MGMAGNPVDHQICNWLSAGGGPNNWEVCVCVYSWTGSGTRTVLHLASLLAPAWLTGIITVVAYHKPVPSGCMSTTSAMLLLQACHWAGEEHR
jgi:hypothetical protein